MNDSPLVDQVVNAVLYEGHILYPYRPSSKKNQQRFTFGRVYPQAYSVAQQGAEPCVMQTECLLRQNPTSAAAELASLEVTVRFLHPMTRAVGALDTPLPELPADIAPGFFRLVPELRLDGKLYQAWQEAVERQVSVSVPSLARITGGRKLDMPFAFPDFRAVEPIRNAGRQVAGALLRRQEAVAGVAEISAQPVDAQVFKLTVRVLNQTPVPPADLENSEAVLGRTFASAHVVLRVSKGEGEFLSLLDPPAGYAQAAAACKNIGVWPVLVGDETQGERGAMLASPIILYDYPKIAPQSAGDLFDGTEIDEILTLRIMTMTDAEKHEAREVDDFARRILERTDTLPAEHLMAMHGVMHETSASERAAVEEFFNPSARLESVTVQGVALRAGDRVRIRPKGRADVMDLALAGKIAVIEAVEQDGEDRVHLALVLEDDPGRDMGLSRMPGHRFFYSLEEVEPLEKS